MNIFIPDYSNIKWDTIITVIVTLFSVWFGTYLQEKKENKISKKERFQRILELQLNINLIENYILAYEESMNNKFFIEDIPCLQKLDISFDCNLKEYAFLTNYNVYLVNLLDIISRQTKLIQNLIDSYINNVYTYINISNSNLMSPSLPSVKLKIENTLAEIKQGITGLKILIVIYNLIIKLCVQGNLDCIYNYRLGGTLGSISFDHIPEYESNSLYKNWFGIIEKGRINPKNIRCLTCLLLDRINLIQVNFIGFWDYKPTNCRKNKEKKNAKNKNLR